MKKNKNITVSFSEVEVKDLYYQMRKDRLHSLHENIKLGKETMYDFDTSMDELIDTLSKSTFYHSKTLSI